MPKEVIMPALGMAQDVGVLLRWLKKEGEPVQAGEPLMEVATDKVEVEVEAPATGVLLGVRAQEGDEIPVGQVIAYIAAEGETPPAPEPAAPKPPQTSAGADAPERAGAPQASPVAARMAAEHGIDISQVPSRSGRVQKEDVAAYLHARESSAGGTPSGEPVLASPKARRLAQEQGIPLARIRGSGPQGAVLAADVEAAVGSEPPGVQAPIPVSSPAGPAGERLELSRMWRVMAQRLTESWTQTPHFYLVRDVDASRLQAWREAASSPETKVTYTDLLVKVTALALRQHPRLAASWQNGAVVASREINIGLAVAVEEGLVTPVLPQVDGLDVHAIAAGRADLVERAVRKELTPDDFVGGVFTISNLGMFGVDAFNAIINPPQAAILAVGRIADRVVPVDGQPVVRPTLTLTLSCDHRVVDGVQAARFLDTLARLIEEPLRAL